MGTKLKLLAAATLFLVLASPTAAKEYNGTIDVEPVGPIQYSLNNDNSVNITVELNTTESIDTAYLQTDEGLETRNYTKYTANISSNSNGTDILYQWDNQYPVTSERLVDYRPYIVTDNGTVYTTPNDDNLTLYYDNGTKYFKQVNTSINVVLTPTIRKTLFRDVKQGEYSLMEAQVTHPVGYAKIKRVEFHVTNPEGHTDIYIARREDKITVNGDTGNKFESYYTETGQVGRYNVDIKVVAEQHTLTAEGSFDVTEKEQAAPPNVKLLSFSISDTSWFEAGAEITRINVVYQMAIGLHLLVLATTFAIVFGGAGYEETEYEDLAVEKNR